VSAARGNPPTFIAKATASSRAAYPYGLVSSVRAAATMRSSNRGIHSSLSPQHLIVRNGRAYTLKDFQRSVVYPLDLPVCQNLGNDGSVLLPAGKKHQNSNPKQEPNYSHQTPNAKSQDFNFPKRKVTLGFCLEFAVYLFGACLLFGACGLELSITASP